MILDKMLFGQLFITYWTVILLVISSVSANFHSYFDLKDTGGSKLVSAGQDGGVFFVNSDPILVSIVDLMIRWRWKKATFLVDGQADLNKFRLNNVLSQAHIDDIHIVMLDLDCSDLKLCLRQHMHKHTQYVIFCNQSNTAEILSWAIFNRMLRNNYQWMIVADILPTILLKTYISVESQIAIISAAKLPENKKKTSDILRQAFPPDFTASNDSISTVYFYEIYYNHFGRVIDFAQFAVWTTSRRLFMLEDFEPADKWKKISGRQIRTISYQVFPFVSITNTSDGQVEFGGHAFDIIRIILVDNFKSEELDAIQADKKSGSKVNGEFVGMARTLFRKESDVSPLLMGRTQDRIEAVEFLVPLAEGSLAMGYKAPKAAVTADAYILPFDETSWLLTLAALLTIIICLTLAEVSTEDDSKKDHSLRFRLITGTFFEEVLDNPRTTSTKVMYATMLIATLLLFSVYTSVLTSFLAQLQTKLPIKSVDDLIVSKEFNPMVITASNYEGVLKNSKDYAMAGIWKKITKCGSKCFAANYADASERIQHGGYTWLTDNVLMKNYVPDPCKCVLIRTPICRAPLLYSARADFPYNRMIYFTMLRLYEYGIVKRFDIKYKLVDYPGCVEDFAGSSMELSQVQGLFYILVGGYFLSFVALIVELFVYRVTRTRRPLSNNNSN